MGKWNKRVLYEDRKELKYMFAIAAQNKGHTLEKAFEEAGITESMYHHLSNKGCTQLVRMRIENYINSPATPVEPARTNYDDRLALLEKSVLALTEHLTGATLVEESKPSEKEPEKTEQLCLKVEEEITKQKKSRGPNITSFKNSVPVKSIPKAKRIIVWRVLYESCGFDLEDIGRIFESSTATVSTALRKEFKVND